MNATAAYVIVTVRQPSVTEPGAMTGFPLLEGQYIDDEGPDQLTIYLADRNDLTAGQEQHLNTQPLVIRYEVINGSDF